MTFIIDTRRQETRPSEDSACWRGSVVAPQERSFRPLSPAGNFRPAGDRYHALSEAERDALIAELAVALATCSPDIQSRMIHGFTAVDEDYGRRVAEALSSGPRN